MIQYTTVKSYAALTQMLSVTPVVLTFVVVEKDEILSQQNSLYMSLPNGVRLILNPPAVAQNGSTDLSSYSTTAQMNTAISTAISNIVNGSPSTLDTLNEIASALANDPNFATTILNQLAGKAANLLPTTVKTAAYTAAANELVKTDASGGNVPVAIPIAPADKTRVCIKQIAVSGSFTTTFTTGGSDVLNKAGGSTTGTLSLLNQAVTLQYEAATAIWHIISSDVPLSQLDLRFATTAQITTANNNISALQSATTSADLDKVSHINMYGTSLTEGLGQNPISGYLWDKSGVPVRNCGVAGESASSIRARLVADTSRLSWPTIIEAGTNGYQTEITTPQTEIATMVAALGHNNYLVLGILGLSTDTVGGSNYNNRVALNNALSSTYGSHYVDIRSYLMTKGTGTGQDATDVSNDVIPSSLRTDATHLTSVGYSHVADKIYQSINILLATTNHILTVSNILALPNYFLRDKIVYTSTAAVSHTGTTANTALASLAGTIPGASIGKNGRYEIVLLLSAGANNANNKQVFVTFNGFNVLIGNLTSNLSIRFMAILWNDNSYVAQISGNSGAGSGTGFNAGTGLDVSTFALSNSSYINTNKDIAVAVSATLANASDTINIKKLQIRAIN